MPPQTPTVAVKNPRAIKHPSRAKRSDRNKINALFRLSPSDYEGLHERYAHLLDKSALQATFSREEDIRKELSTLFEGMMRTLYKVEGAQFRIEILETPKMRNFIEAHAAALDSSFEKVAMSDTMRKRLQRSDYIFSGMKTFHELNEAFPSLLDENGNRKSFEQFLNDVQSIDSTYNRNYLRAEYNFVQASAQMAAKWESFMQDGDRYNLQYRTAGDDKVRPEHAALDRITLPITDPFWEEYYPPNGWNCRCTVVQVRKSKYPVTPHDEAMALGRKLRVRTQREYSVSMPDWSRSPYPTTTPIPSGGATTATWQRERQTSCLFRTTNCARRVA